MPLRQKPSATSSPTVTSLSPFSTLATVTPVQGTPHAAIASARSTCVSPWCSRPARTLLPTAAHRVTSTESVMVRQRTHRFPSGQVPLTPQASPALLGRVPSTFDQERWSQSLIVQTPTRPRRVLTFEEVRERLRISRSHLYEVVGTGGARKLTIGRSRRFTEDVDEYIAQREARGA